MNTTLNKEKFISPETSFVLDTLRIIAALTVLFFHAIVFWFPEYNHNPDSAASHGHFAVFIFFVLSGYVITYSTYSKKSINFLIYIKARVSRLVSIVYPALFICLLLVLYLYFFDHHEYLNTSRGNFFVRLIITSLFLNEIWFFSAAPLVNIPLWSLSFEFWYYVIFGCWFFRKNILYGNLVLIIVCLIAGPKILSLMPIWIFGCLAYLIPGSTLKFRSILIPFIIITAFVMLYYIPPVPFKLGYQPLFFANQFLTDWLAGLMVAFAVWLIPTTHVAQVQMPFFFNVYRKIADLTFPIYVLHYPIIYFYKSIFGMEKGNINDFIIGFTVVFIVTVIVGLYLEKHRNLWNNWVEALFKLLSKKMNKFKMN